MDYKSLVAKMTMEEKASMCSGKDFWNTEEVESIFLSGIKFLFVSAAEKISNMVIRPM